MDFYQYLLRNNGFKVSDTGYFVYCNGIKQKDRFDEKLEFKISLLDYTGNTNWIEKTLENLVNLLNQEEIPGYTEDCKYCEYQEKTRLSSH
jgi:hypothetical protein